MSGKPYDLVVFGASGFTGRLVAEYLAQHAPGETRWALAGRNERKLCALRERFAQDRCPPADVVIADVTDRRSLRAMADLARVVLTTAGPYVRYGVPVVQAAVEAGSDYVDITGEPEFVHACLEQWDGPARDRGVRIVNCCGFDSVPHDLGALFTAQQLPPGEPMTIEAFVRSRGSFSGGTWHSAIHAFSRLHAGAGRSLRSDRVGERRVRLLPRRVKWVPEIAAWAVPLPTIDPEIVLRSARALEVFGPDFRYGHYVRVRHLSSVLGGIAAVGAIVALAQWLPTRALLLRVKKPGEGPSPEQRAKAWFEVTFLGEAGARRVITTVSGGDPGYGETAKMVAESALCLVHDRAVLPPVAGVLTPAVAMGDRLRDRLQRAGIRFHVKERV
jgi:short subunit dehydrogenase-like uncharacterized protein